MSTGQPVVGLHPIFAWLDTIMSQNSAAMLCSVGTSFSFLKARWNGSGTHGSDKRCGRGGRTGQSIVGFTKAGKSWTSHPIAPVWGTGCFACFVGSIGEHPKTWCWGWSHRLLAPALTWGTGPRAWTIKECSGTLRRLQMWKLHGCGARFLRDKWWDGTKQARLSPSFSSLYIKHKRSKCLQAVIQSQTQLHLNWVCRFMSLWPYNMGL